LTTPAVCLRDNSFFTELRKAHISCPVPEGDAPLLRKNRSGKRFGMSFLKSLVSSVGRLRRLKNL
jgi:hypothetical protein